MALIICPDCGKEVSDKAVSCPNCGCPLKSTQVIEEQNIPEKKKSSVLSIVSIVLLFFLPPIALILALIDLLINDKTKTHLYSWFVFFLGILACGFIAWIYMSH